MTRVLLSMRHDTYACTRRSRLTEKENRISNAAAPVLCVPGGQKARHVLASPSAEPECGVFVLLPTNDVDSVEVAVRAAEFPTSAHARPSVTHRPSRHGMYTRRPLLRLRTGSRAPLVSSGLP